MTSDSLTDYLYEALKVRYGETDRAAAEFIASHIRQHEVEQAVSEQGKPPLSGMLTTEMSSTSESLIEKINSRRQVCHYGNRMQHDEIGAYNDALSDAIDIIRQHEAESVQSVNMSSKRVQNPAGTEHVARQYEEIAGFDDVTIEQHAQDVRDRAEAAGRKVAILTSITKTDANS